MPGHAISATISPGVLLYPRKGQWKHVYPSEISSMPLSAWVVIAKQIHPIMSDIDKKKESTYYGI